MKAKRKSDGAIIDVRLYDIDTSTGKFIFIDDSTNTHYNKADLDFNVEETKEVTIDGWVARDSNGTLWICSEEPQRYSDWWIIDTDEEYTKKELPSYLFPDLTWESEAVEVSITIKPKKQ